MAGCWSPQTCRSPRPFVAEQRQHVQAGRYERLVTPHKAVLDIGDPGLAARLGIAPPSVQALRQEFLHCYPIAELLRWVDAGGRFDYQRPGRAPDGRVRESLMSLSEFHDDRLNHSPAKLTELFIHERMLAVQAFGTPQPRDALRRLRYVVAQARLLASSGATTLRQLRVWLETRQREQYYDIESAVPDSDEDAVRFMTVHGSKGLEFPIVVLTGLSAATSRVGPQSVDLVPNYAANGLEVRCGEFSTVGYGREPDRAMYEAEQKRLLYVATTRARDHLVLSLFCGKEDSHAVRIRTRVGARVSPRAPASPRVAEPEYLE